jgi:hypothetical protein
MLLSARRLHNKMIPTEDNLLRRSVAISNSSLCTGDCEKDESINYLLIGCDFYGSIWHLFHRRCGISKAISVDAGEHALQSGGTHAFKKDISLGFQVVS